jgi:hypothetical protein
MKVLFALCLIAATVVGDAEWSDALVGSNPFTTPFKNNECNKVFITPKLKLIKTAGASCAAADNVDFTYACDVFSNLVCNSEQKCQAIPDEGGDCEKTRTGSLGGCMDGLFCMPNDAGDKHTCTKEGAVGDKCKSDKWCQQGYGCHFVSAKAETDGDGTCQEYASVAAGGASTNFYFCEFGLNVKDDKCTDTATGADTIADCTGNSDFCFDVDAKKCTNILADCKSKYLGVVPSGKGKARHTVLSVYYDDNEKDDCGILKCKFDTYTGLDDYTQYLDEFDCSPASVVAPLAALVAAVAALLFL